MLKLQHACLRFSFIFLISSTSLVIAEGQSRESDVIANQKLRVVSDSSAEIPSCFHRSSAFISHAKRGQLNATLGFCISKSSPYITGRLDGATATWLNSMSEKGNSQRRSAAWGVNVNSISSSRPYSTIHNRNARQRMPLIRTGIITCGTAVGFGGFPHGSVPQCPSLPSFSSPPTILRVRGGGWLGWSSATPEISRKEASSSAADNRQAQRTPRNDGEDGAGRGSGNKLSWWERNRYRSLSLRRGRMQLAFFEGRS